MMQTTLPTLADVNLSGQRVMIREDLNVPIQDGNVAHAARIERALPTIQQALSADAAVIVLSHLGRPEEGVFDPAYSLAPVAKALTDALGQPVTFIQHWLDGVDVQPGQVVLCENTRFNVGEKANDPVLAKRIAALCDVFVMDAFATAHRAHASTAGAIEYAPKACAGPLLLAELNALSRALQTPKKPLVAVVGGAKVSTKFPVLTSLLDRVDCLYVGGGIANTFLAAKGHPVGASLYEPDWIETAEQLLDTAQKRGVDIPLPQDVCVAQAFSEDAPFRYCALPEVQPNEMILDVGPKTAATYASALATAGTIVWNGPVGVFEWSAFSHGTAALGRAIAQSAAYSIAGGGDTLAAVDAFGLAQEIDYICTGGGAFLEYVEGKTLPCIQRLAERA